MPDVHVFFKFGQSNARGTDDAVTALSAAAPYPAIRYWRRTLADSYDSDAFEDLDVLGDGSYGDELALGTSLVDAGLTVAIIKVVKGGTFMNQWIPGNQNHTEMIAELEAAMAELPTEFPGHDIRWAGVEVDQGESEIRHAADSVKTNWTGFAETVIGTIEDTVGQALRRYVVLTRFELTGAVNPQVFRDAQLALSNARFVSRDDTTVLGDGVHDTSESQNIKGSRVAALYLEDLEVGATSTAEFDRARAAPALISIADVSAYASAAEFDRVRAAEALVTLTAFGRGTPRGRPRGSVAITGNPNKPRATVGP